MRTSAVLEAHTPVIVGAAVGFRLVDCHRLPVLGLLIMSVRPRVRPKRPAVGLHDHTLAVERRRPAAHGARIPDFHAPHRACAGAHVVDAAEPDLRRGRGSDAGELNGEVEDVRPSV